MSIDQTDNPEENEFDSQPNAGDDAIHDIIPISGLYENWFLEYASYVILERAVPAIEDGFKPVQRRILHAMKEMDDGRFNKVANIIGSTMQYHPHGDASIGDAIVGLGQKELLIDTQGNWGDNRTGDGSAAPRYIEARLSKFGLEVVFNPDTTEWQLSYDGRKREPVTLPVKFPLLLAQGVEGIAVGLSTKIMPHNFCELIEASIDLLNGKETNVLPDFHTGGMVDVTNYNGGLRGSKVRVRAKIEEFDKKTLLIKEIPFSCTTTSLIDSIVKANDTGKIKIKKVIDNTAKDVEIQIQLQPGVSPDITIDALYAFTDCEVSISPNACVIIDDRPHFMNVNDILRICTAKTKELLKRELEIELANLREKIFFTSLLRIFIQEGMYKNKEYENSGSFDNCCQVLDTLFEPYFAQFYRPITPEDYRKLIDKPLSSITRFDVSKVDEQIKSLQDEIAKVESNLKHLNKYTIDFYKRLLDKFGKGRERKTLIQVFDNITATSVAAANEKLYVNRKEGFIGYGLKKDEFVCDCSDIDDIIAFRSDGKYSIVKVQDKVFMGKDIIHVGVFKKGDERMVYNAVYMDGASGKTMVKRFQVTGITRDKEYDLTMGNKGSKLLYFSANANGEAETITIQLTPASTARTKVYDYSFTEIEIKGRNSQGNTLTKYPVRKVIFKSAGVSTLGGIDISYDEIIGRLNTEKRGKYLGNFLGDDKILVITKDGSYEITSFELTNRYIPAEIELIEKLDTNKIINVVHYDGAQANYFVKRFKIETTTLGKKFLFISESKGSNLVLATTAKQPQIEVESKKVNAPAETTIYDMDMLIDIKGWKALGNRLTNNKVLKVKLLASKVEDDIEKVVEEDKKTEGENIEAGTTIELSTKPSKPDNQLGLF